MIKRNHFIYIFVAVIAVLVLTAGIVFGTKGANVSYDWAGGSQIRIVCENAETAEQAKTLVKSTLKDNKITINSISTSTNGVSEIVEVTTKSKDIKATVNAKLVADVTALGATTNGLERTYSAHRTAAWIVPVTVIALCVAGALVTYFVTRRWRDFVTFAVGFAAAALAELSLHVITRTEIGTESVVGCFVGLVMFTALAIVLLSEVKNAQNTAKHENSALYNIVKDVRQNSILKLSALYIVIMLAAIVTVVVGTKQTMFFGISLILALASALYAAYVILLETKCEFDTALDGHYTNKMSQKEPVQELKTTSNAKAKPEANTASASKTAVKKRKRRNRTQDKVVV